MSRQGAKGEDGVKSRRDARAARAACRPVAGCGADATAGVQGRWSCWDAADALHDGTDYAGLAKLWPRAKGPGPVLSHTRQQFDDARHASPAGLDRCRDETQSVRARIERLTQQALTLLHWGLISEKRSERRLARQIMRKWLRVDDSGDVVFWQKPPKRHGRKPARKRSSWRERRQAARRARKSAARQRLRDWLEDLGAPLVLRPVPARMRRQAQSKPQMNTDKRRWKRQKQQDPDVLVTRTLRPGRRPYPRSSVSIGGNNPVVVGPHPRNLRRKPRGYCAARRRRVESAAMGQFRVHSDFQPQGDQPAAIAALADGFRRGEKQQTLLGVTGSGKTFVAAKVIEQLDRPVLVISHNKTLAAQLYAELKAFFPENAVEYFVSYYDYYQPEAYIPQKDIYIEKDAAINEHLDRLRLAATSSLMWRRDVVIVASVSCIYGLGSPADYLEMMVRVECGQELDRTGFLRKLAAIQYARNDLAFERGRFRVRGETVDVWPAYEERALRVELDGERVERISEFHPASGEILASHERAFIYPAKHFVLPAGTIERALASIDQELTMQLEYFRSQGKLLEAQRLEARTRYDLELMEQVGYCPGIENYSRHLAGRPPGSRPYCLLDYFPKDFLLVIDESHVTVPQIRGMYFGDRSRKETLVEHGFRLPSALDNRPLRFEEFEGLTGQTAFVSATPGPYELARCGGAVVELLVRPTGLVDPPIEVRPARDQVADVIREIQALAAKGQRALVTTLTKRSAERVAEYLQGKGLRCRYLHSEIDAFERVELLRDLRKGEFDALVGVNLLREGLDLPEVTLVAVLDADREGFLRSQTSLIQTIGRTARNVAGRVLLYADQVTGAIQKTMEETGRRREKQLAYNREHGITPRTVRSAIKAGIAEILAARQVTAAAAGCSAGAAERAEHLAALESEMHALAAELRFEEAARLRDRILELQGREPQAPRHPRGGRGRRGGRR